MTWNGVPKVPCVRSFLSGRLSKESASAKRTSGTDRAVTDGGRTLGDGWCTEGSTALLSVPSAIVPETFNVR